MDLVANGLVVAGLLLAVIAAIQAIAARGWLPESSLLAIVGLVVGAGYATLTRIAPEVGPSLDIIVRPDLPAEAYLWIFLPPLLFQAALTTDVRSMMPDAAPILLLAIVAVFVATGLIGWSLAIVSAAPSQFACLWARSSPPPTHPRSSPSFAVSVHRLGSIVSSREKAF
ncbi:cation:proton antiporter domain-containing protein [Ochrobactrum soli]|uniref:Na+/H+ antiporter n=1 Tax=Ochrobactrum soli TaxID=2448455 RepID=A0A2P9HEW4_9HYPH|nr:cation:proton antiporter [[Ochrobactrum] soli]SPL62636.1 Na+/H+ antiporter [[Ochrobactrum] soli]